MKQIPKWLMVPPVVAVLLVLGPLSMRGSETIEQPANANTISPDGTSVAPATVAPADGARTVRTPTLPRTPDFWQIGSALIGVLLLGGLAVYGLRRLRGGAVPTRGTTLITLRQTLRLSPKQALHAIEFDDRILLVGETERGMALVESGKAIDRSSDETEAMGKATAMLNALLVEDEGAVPKNLVIPRPDRASSGALPRRGYPTQPVMPKPTAKAANLNDFRALLHKAGHR